LGQGERGGEAEQAATIFSERFCSYGELHAKTFSPDCPVFMLVTVFHAQVAHEPQPFLRE
jgi:hypothetical protein